MTISSPRIASIGYLARRIGVSARSLRELAESGRIPCIRTGSTYLVDIIAAEAALLELARKAPDEGGDR